MAGTRYLLKMFSISANLKLANIGLGFLTTVLLVRLMSVGEFGVYSFWISLVSIVTIPAVLGVPEVLIRESSKLIGKEDWGSLRRLMTWAGLSVVATTVGATIALFLFLRIGYGSPAANDIAWLLIILVAVTALNSTRSAILIGLMKPIQGQVSDTFVKPFILSMVLLAAFLLSKEISTNQALVLNIIATAFSFLIGAWLLSRALSAIPRVGLKPEKRVFKEWSISAVPLAFISGMYVVNQQMDILMLGLMSSSVEVGIYKVVSQLGMLVIFGQQMVRPVISSRFSYHWSRGEISKVQSLVVFSGRVSFTLALGVALVFIIFGKFLLHKIFGQEFVDGYAALVILCCGQVVNAAVGSVGNLLNMCGKEKASIKGLICGLLVSVIMGLLLIPFYGGLGAAISTSLGMLVWNLLLWKTVREHLGIKPTIFRV